MSTGHKPTFYAAVGKQASGGLATWQVSVKDQLGQKKLKFRQFGQATQNEMAVRDLRGEIDEKEKQSLTEGKRGFAAITNHSKAIEAPKLLLMDAPAINVDEIKSKYDDADAVEADSDSDLESRLDNFLFTAMFFVIFVLYRTLLNFVLESLVYEIVMKMRIVTVMMN
jgi:hypothetical protein